MGKGERPSERLRVPQPLIRSRVPSGRGATEQPNVTGDGETALTPAFWLALAATGVAAGLLGALLMLILFEVQYAAFGYHSGTFQAGVEAAGVVRRILSLLVAGAFGGVAWYLLRRATRGEHSEVDDAIWRGDGRLAFRRSLGTSLISEVVIGMGASLGREAAPKTMGGAAASVFADRLRLSTAQRRLLVACGGGAGLAAVYNVPLGGALFTAEILLGTITLPVILPALACSGIATLTAWVYLSRQATYLDVPDYRVGAAVLVWALLAGPVIGLAAAGYIRLVGWVSHHQPAGRRALLAPLAAFAVLGVVGIWYPQLFGNGKDMAHDAFVGTGTMSLFAVLFVLKPLLTSLCLASGASGGLFTPVLSTGAVFGALLGAAWSQLWPGSPTGAYAMVGAAAMIGAGMQAPLVGLVLVLELTHTSFGLMIPMIAATVTATAVARHIDGYSIYSARLPATGKPGDPQGSPGAEDGGSAAPSA
ncbi:chloride channel protein [Streptacidiphilus sp. PB12-B1b]|uniref:chloride channel protein n=1 Tax=Streptacidiphilus sp. PB12-B1b TaxID=2705012 RepID=UPI0015F8856E|nr:chloride channel protein [Streptacidiphilus sp. PB12-B1b]QMU74701.1 chloride channel protein [Streptacidiphilus sp. PB12-B1b]